MAESVGTIKVRNKSYAVTLVIHNYRGQKPASSFACKVNGRIVSADSVEKLYDKIMLETKAQAVKIEVPFMVVTRPPFSGSEWRLKTGTVTQRNPRHQKMVVRWEDGTVDRDYAASYGGSFKVLTPVQQVEYVRLLAAKKQADKAELKFRDEHTFNLGLAVDEAIKKATEE